MIIFDLDGTLINSEVFHHEIEVDVKNELGFPITLKEQIERFAGFGPGQQAKIDTRLPKEFVEIATERIREQAPFKLRASKGAQEFLDIYNGPKCIASNGPLEWITKALECVDLYKYFEDDQIFHVNLVDNCKPAPDLFLHAVEKLNHNGPITVIEDSPIGVTAARAAGLRTFGYTGNSFCPEEHKETMLDLGAELVFNDYDQLRELI